MKRPQPGTIASLAIVSLALALPVPGLWVYQGPPMEEGFMLAFPQRILAGELPHVDFLHLYGPGSLYVLALVYKLFGSTLGVERAVGLVQHALLVFGMFALARLWGRRAATLAALTALVITISPLGLSAMAWNGALGLAVVGLALVARGLERPGRGVIAGAGLCFGGALLYRPDMVVAVGLAALVAWLVVGRDDEARPLRVWGIGGLIVPLLAYVPFLVAVGPSDAFTGMFTQPVFDLRKGRALPVPPSWAEPDGYLQKAGGLRVASWPLPMPGIGPQIAMWFWLVPISILFVAVVAWRCLRRSPLDVRCRALAVAAAFDLGLISQALQRPDTAHLSWVTCVSFALVPLAIADLVRSNRAERPEPARPGLVPLAAFVPIGVVLLVIIPFYPLRTYADLVGQTFGHNVFGYPIRRGDRVFYYGSKDAADSAQSVVDALAEQSKPGERLIVGPLDMSRTPYSDAFFYYLFPELLPGTRYIEMDPGIADAKGSGLADDLANGEWLIQSDVWTGWTEPNSSADAGDTEPNRVVARDYCPVVDTGKFRLSKRCHL
ncbi:MAG: hypothetical protein U0Q22_07785 [Acidimicrobiales bacterium]